MAERKRCPECGEPISPRAAPDGICPRCLLKLGLPTPQSGRSAPPEDPETTKASPPPLEPANRIGPYRILQKLGEGGMGVVYQAEQEQPIRRKVALKLIKAGMDTKRVVARFESERQALALMSHANIARVYEAGATEQGRPYFVMEYVQGVPITEYCDKHRLTTNERLGLFMQVCAGVQHAHQKGIIHRDIKPSNVLVGLEDTEPIPKIIDFGVARATEQRLTEKSVFTQIGMLIGTPEYMSPEQAEMTALDIDTRTDVYSLGVLLYELLVGALPFEPQDLRRVAFDQICRKIREEEPSKPSARVSTLGGVSAEVARRRKTDPSSLARELRSDLDWITMKALEKDRTRRYGSPNEFAADIERYLQHEPIIAGAPSTAYRARKFVRRHRVGVAFAALVVLLLAGFAVTMTMQAARIARERDTAEQVSEFLVGLFEVSDPSEARGKTITAREVLDRGAEKIEHELVDQPEVRGRLLHTMGRVYSNIGLYDSGESLLKEALENRRNLLGDNHPATLETMVVLAWLYSVRGNHTAAEPLLRHVLEIHRRVGDEHPDTLATMSRLGNLYRNLGRYEDAELLLRTALEGQRRVLDKHDKDTLNTMANLGVLHMERGRYDEAESLLLEVLEAFRATRGEDHPDTLVAAQMRTGLLVIRGRYDEAQRWYQEIVEHQGRVLGEEHTDTLQSKGDLANLYRNQGKYEEAESLQLQVLEAQRRVLDERDRFIGRSLFRLAWGYEAQGRYNDAESALHEAIEILCTGVGEDHPWTLLSQRSLADVYVRQQRYDDAESLFAQVLETQNRVLGEDDPEALTCMDHLARLYLNQDRYDEARPLVIRLLASRKRRAEGSADAVASNAYAWAALTCEPADLRDPRSALRFALAANEKTGYENPGYLDTLSLAYHLTGDTAKAIQNQKKAIALMPEEESSQRAMLESALAKFEAALEADPEAVVDTPP